MGKEGISTTRQEQEKIASMNRAWSRYRGGNGNGGGDRRPPQVRNRFKGEITWMGGHVFQCHSEQRERGEFDETMGALKTFASTKYVEWIDYLTPIFVDMLEPTLTNPKLAITEEVIILKDYSKRKISSSATEELEEFRINLKEYLKDVKSVKTIKRSLHNVMWG